eukprot:431670_1
MTEQDFGDYYMDKIDNGRLEDVMDDTILHAFMTEQANADECQYLFNTRYSDAEHNVAPHAYIENQVYKYYQKENPAYAKVYKQNNCYQHNSQYLLKQNYGLNKQFDEFARHWPEEYGIPSCEAEAYWVHDWYKKAAQRGRENLNRGKKRYSLARETFSNELLNQNSDNYTNVMSDEKYFNQHEHLQVCGDDSGSIEYDGHSQICYHCGIDSNLIVGPGGKWICDSYQTQLFQLYNFDGSNISLNSEANINEYYMEKQRQLKREEKLRKEHRKNMDKLEKEIEQQREMYYQQICEASNKTMNEVNNTTNAYKNLCDEHMAKAKSEKQLFTSYVMNEIETLYNKLNDVCIPQIIDLNNKIE